MFRYPFYEEFRVGKVAVHTLLLGFDGCYCGCGDLRCIQE